MFGSFGYIVNLRKLVGLLVVSVVCTGSYPVFAGIDERLSVRSCIQF